MNSKIIVVRKDKINNNKEWIYILSQSIYDIKKKNDNIYTLKKMIELEKLLKPNEIFSYEFKLIDEEEYEALLLNYEINDVKAPQLGSFFAFLVNYARNLDSYYTKEPSTIYMSNSSYDKLKFWVKQTINKVSCEQRRIEKNLKNGK